MIGKNIFYFVPFKYFLYFFAWKTKSLNHCIDEAHQRNFANINIFPLKNRVVGCTTLFFLIARYLTLQASFWSNSVIVFVFRLLSSYFVFSSIYLTELFEYVFILDNFIDRIASSFLPLCISKELFYLYNKGCFDQV